MVDFRRKLSETALKVISGEVSLGVRELLSLSNQKIDTILQDIASVPAQDKLQQEALSLLKENTNLRKVPRYPRTTAMHTYACASEPLAHEEKRILARARTAPALTRVRMHEAPP